MSYRFPVHTQQSTDPEQIKRIVAAKARLIRSHALLLKNAADALEEIMRHAMTHQTANTDRAMTAAANLVLATLDL